MQSLLYSSDSPVAHSFFSPFRISCVHNIMAGQELLQKIILFMVFVAPQIVALGYDFLIIGGGTSGLVIANRLSELPNITVAVIEAGGEVDNNPNVTNIDNFLQAIGTPIDWQYLSTPQIYAAGQRVPYASGKALGGSSTINGKNLSIASEPWLMKKRNDLYSCPKGPN
jgi:hypothetical protein